MLPNKAGKTLFKRKQSNFHCISVLANVKPELVSYSL